MIVYIVPIWFIFTFLQESGNLHRCCIQNSKAKYLNCLTLPIGHFTTVPIYIFVNEILALVLLLEYSKVDGNIFYTTVAAGIISYRLRIYTRTS